MELRGLLAAALVVLGTLAGETAAEPARRRAVLVGINEYAAPEVRDLNGTHNDVAAMRALLIQRYGFAVEDVRVLLDAQATHAGILAALREHLVDRGADDVAVFYFSGHGSQMQDASGDEADRWDETLVAHDSRLPDVFDVSDDEINAVLAEIAADTPNLTAIFDSCHSGTGARGVAQVRRIAPDPREPPVAAARATTVEIEGRSGFAPLGANFVLIAGSRAHELSNEDRFDGRIQGALTYHLTQALQAQPTIELSRVFPDVVSRVGASFPQQHPQLEGSGIDGRAFGTGVAAAEQLVRVEPDGEGRARVDAGSAYGLGPGATIDVFAPGGQPPGDASRLGTLTLDRVEADRAFGSLGALKTLPEHSRGRVTRLPLGSQPLTVWLSTDLPASIRAAVAELLVDDPVVPDDPHELNLRLDARAADADVRVVPEADGSAVLLARDGAAMSHAALDGADASGALVEQLKRWAMWKAKLSLANPHSRLSLAVTLEPQSSDTPAPAPASVLDGSVLTLRIANRSTQSLNFAVLDIGSTGRLEPIFPLDRGTQATIAAGSTFDLPLRLALPEGRASMRDTFKVVAATFPVDGYLFAQAAIDRSARSDASADERYLADRLLGLSRDATVFGLKDWTTAQASVEIRSGASIEAAPTFAVHLPRTRDAAALKQTLDGQRDLCPTGRAPADCSAVVPLDDSGLRFEVRSPALTGSREVGGAQVLSVSSAFDEAYRLGDAIPGAYVEPLLEVRGPDGPAEDTADGARGTRAAPDPIALGDLTWSLKYAGVPGAWQQVQQATGREHGRESEGIVVAHPDTGYTRHPESWGKDPDSLTIDVAHDLDLVDDDDDALDPLERRGLLANPGHGTASGSVIVSRDGCDAEGTTQCVTGTGPGAKLVPLRVNRSVVLFSMRRLVKAISAASDGSLGRVDLVSIAMGGPPTRALHAAVEAAEAKGVIVVAAAGNYVQTVVWPARFDNVIAVSAVNPQCAPWSHASHGSAVDISAPGEGVWRATFDDDGNAIVGMGEGTTFATGTVSGITSLWLARHAGSAALEAHRQAGTLTAVYRAALQKTAWRPDGPAANRPPNISCGATSWNAREYGPGIVNAAALLQEPLPDSTGGLERVHPAVLPLFSGLLPPGSTPSAETTYRALFRDAPLAQVERYESELMYHYATNDEVREAVDRWLLEPSSQAAIGAVHHALRAQDLSLALRRRLRSA